MHGMPAFGADGPLEMNRAVSRVEGELAVADQAQQPLFASMRPAIAVKSGGIAIGASDTFWQGIVLVGRSRHASYGIPRFGCRAARCEAPPFSRRIDPVGTTIAFKHA